MNDNSILKVKKGSIAEEIGLEKGDKLVAINGNKVKDIIDYKFLICDELIKIEVIKVNSELWEIDVEKEYDEDLGIEFEESTIDKPRSCHNKCVFCFIDQLPKGMRDTLYFKDDDSRLSFLQGNFITLTNMKKEDFERIIKYKISPINISVHTTNPELRIKMLNNRFAGDILKKIKQLADAGICMNCQIVSCPGLNNGAELIKTVEDLYTFHPYVKNVAVVPIGLTKYREGLCKLKMYSRDTARDEIKIISHLQEKYEMENNTPFVRLSDEFYLTAQIDVPEEEFYDGYEQLEDGIGIVRSFRENINKHIYKLNKYGNGNFVFVTGVSAYDEICKAASLIMNNNHNIKIKVRKIINHFFGETITVSGLLTGKDIIEQLKDQILPEHMILPDNVTRRGYELCNNDEKMLLDDISIDELENKLKTKIFLSSYNGENLIDIINECIEEEK